MVGGGTLMTEMPFMTFSHKSLARHLGQQWTSRDWSILTLPLMEIAGHSYHIYSLQFSNVGMLYIQCIKCKIANNMTLNCRPSETKEESSRFKYRSHEEKGAC